MAKEKIHVAVSGTGGGVGQSIVKSLQDTNYEVIALDGDVLGAGLYATRKSYIIPYSKSPDFIDKVLEICKMERCKLYFPGLDAELPILSKNIDRFTAIGTTVVVSSADVIEIGDNKMTTYVALSKHGALVPRTIDLSEVSIESIDLEYPFILKQREGGARSQNIYIINSEDDFKQLEEKNLKFESYIAQEYIDGPEYTCGSINLDGECKGVIVMRRILRDGDTYKCFPVRDFAIENEVKKIMNAIKPFGACNVQLRVKDGRIYVFEINARCSGTTAARTLSGFNEPKMIADYLCSYIEPEFTIKEQTILRYWKELVVPNNDVDFMKEHGFLENKDPEQL